MDGYRQYRALSAINWKFMITFYKKKIIFVIFKFKISILINTCIAKVSYNIHVILKVVVILRLMIGN